MTKTHKLPRLYLPSPLTLDGDISFTSDQSHYLKNVLRQNEGDRIRAFNGQDGEWLLTLQSLSKKAGTASCTEQICAQPESTKEIHLYFAPIKKNRMDFLIEKAVELGVTDLHPVLTEHTEVRKINSERIEAQIIEAAEQCERLDLPNLHPQENFTSMLSKQSKDQIFLAAIERAETATPLAEITYSTCMSALIGPEGGFSEQEISLLKKSAQVQSITLGQNILRAETAALKILSYLGD